MFIFVLDFLSKMMMDWIEVNDEFGWVDVSS